LQRLQNKVLRTIGDFPRLTPVRDLHMVFKLQSMYDYITKLCRKKAEVTQNHKNANIFNIGQGEPRHSKYKRLKLGGGQAYGRSGDWSSDVCSSDLSRLGIRGRHSSSEIAAPAKQGSPHHWQFSKAHTGPRSAHGIQNPILIL
jgi:hypothetical protein